MRIVSWNVNSVRLRLPHILKLIKKIKPSIICLQETKCPNHLFPLKPLEARGYIYHALCGVKSYNGVCILSQHKLSNITQYDFCKKGDARHISASVSHNKKKITLHNIYVPAGGDEPCPKLNEKFAHKLQFLREMKHFLSVKNQKGFMLAMGDFNIAPLPNDVWSHQQLLQVVSHTDIEVKHLNHIIKQGQWVDVARQFVPEEQKLYSWWSYRNQDWEISDRGRRLDHIWANQKIKNHIERFHIEKVARLWQHKTKVKMIGPSDHVPLWIELK